MLPAFIQPIYEKLYLSILSKISRSQSNILQLSILFSKPLRKDPWIRKHISKNYSSTNNSETFTLPTKAYKLHGLPDGPSNSITISTEQARKLFTEMFIIRRMEIITAKLYMSKAAHGFCHLYIGQEAVAVGIHSQMTNRDATITSYRCHAWAYLSGVTTYQVLAELCAKETGNVRGKGGSMHMFSSTFYGGHAIVGAQAPLGTGVALSMMYQKKDAVMVVLYGDGAANQGQVFESFNMAKLWNLPVIFVCENNIYAMGTSSKRSSASIEFYKRGDSVPGIYVDGMDILTVCEATKFAMNYVKAGNGPIIMEMSTYRFQGHSMSDPGSSYRTKQEVAEVRKTKDPITTFKAVITKNGILTEEEIKKIEKQERIRIETEAKKILSDPIIKDEELAYDIYKNALEPDVRGISPWTRMQHKNIGIRNEGNKS